MSRTLPLLRRTATRHQSAKPLGGRRSSVTFAPQDAFTEALESEVPGPLLVPASAAAQPQQGQAQQQHLPNSRGPFQGSQQQGAASLQQPAQQVLQCPEPGGVAGAAGGQGQQAAALGACSSTEAALVKESGAEGQRQGADGVQVAAVQADSAAALPMSLSEESTGAQLQAVPPSRAEPSTLLSEGFVGAEAGKQQGPLDASTAGCGGKNLPLVAGVPPAASAPEQQSQAHDQGPGEQAAGPEEPALQQTPEGHLEPELSGDVVL